MIKKLLPVFLVVAVALFLLVQTIPYGRDHSNPAVIAEPAWDRPQTRELAARACFDCHSNETHWPWYSHVAPASWLVQRDVVIGRQALNFSEWNRQQEEAVESAETVREGSMPPRMFLLAHAQARLSTEERQILAEGLATTLGREAQRENEEAD